MPELTLDATIGGATVHLGTAQIRRAWGSASGSAPEVAGYEIFNLTGFTAGEPAVGEVYDPQMHEPEVYWTIIDEAYSFVAPVNLHGPYFDSGIAYGPKITKTWRTGGQKRLEAFIYEPATGVTALATFTDNIGFEDAEYPGAQTHHLDVNGVHANAPVGATLHTTLDAAWDAINTGNEGISQRLLLERGQVHTPSALAQLGLNANRKHILIKDVGSGAIPRINTDNATVTIGQGNSIVATREVDLKLQNVRFQGTFDVTDFTGDDVDCITTFEHPPKQLLLDGVEIRGYKIGVSPIFVSTQISQPYICLNDTIIEDFRSAAMFGDSAWSITGCRIAQNPNALVTNGVGIDYVGCGRFPASPYVYIHATDSFPRSAWTPVGAGGNGRQYDLQASWRFITNVVAGAFVGLNCSTMECGITAFGFNIDDGDNSLPINAVCQNNYCLGYSDSFNFIDTHVGGITLRKNIFVHPSGPTDDGVFYTFFVFREKGAVNAANRAAPINIIDNTVVSLKTTAQQSEFAPIPVVENAGVYTINETGTRNFQPFRGGTDLTGIDTTTVFTPRYPGYRDTFQPTMQTQFATPDQASLYDHVYMAPPT